MHKIKLTKSLCRGSKGGPWYTIDYKKQIAK